MRELIRPAFFLVARLGLFLSVAAWIAGQWWTPLLDVNRTGLCRLSFSFEQTGWAISNLTPSRQDPQWLEIKRNDRRPPHYWVLWVSEPVETIRQLVEPEQIAETDMFGIVYGHHSVFWGLTIRHWTVVSFFALSCGVLQWACRKRGEEVVQ